MPSTGPGYPLGIHMYIYSDSSRRAEFNGATPSSIRCFLKALMLLEDRSRNPTKSRPPEGSHWVVIRVWPIYTYSDSSRREQSKYVSLSSIGQVLKKLFKFFSYWSKSGSSRRPLDRAPAGAQTLESVVFSWIWLQNRIEHRRLHIYQWKPGHFWAYFESYSTFLITFFSFSATFFK